ncbi:hypothetical protein FAVG1_02306 [Fusarium avenaceum]|nr:hypothetical protein FAVG1_02306 [Fusarium avenaceum]
MLNVLAVSEYLGIPYAKPPTGSLRFEPPQELDAVHDINATAFISLKNISLALALPSDTLVRSQTVMVEPQVGEKKKAILVWIHGGAYSYGSSREPNYNGEYIADQEDFILISLNYRLGIFCFPGNPSTASNLGLLDLRQDLLWIRQNAANFGGDVDRVTLFRHSAGAGMIDLSSYTYNSDPIASDLVLMSATVDGFPALSKESTASRWSRIAGAVGCQSINANSVTECMKDNTTDDILSAFGSEDTLQFLFYTVPQSPIPSILEQVKVGEYLRGAWAAFAKDPKEGLLSYEEGWPKYLSTGETFVRLAFDNQSGRNLAQGNTYDRAC